jgi:hypothetical protein
MTLTRTVFGVILTMAVAFASVQAADVSRQRADSFAKKIEIISQRGNGKPLPPSSPARTAVTESEVNSWLAYRAGNRIPKGVTAPTITIIGNGKLMGLATVDLEAYGKSQRSGGGSGMWDLLGGSVPVTVTGVLQSRSGRGQFQLERATLGGLPIPKSLLQEMVEYFSRTPDNPEGVQMDAPFALPAKIQQIEVGQGQAIVVQ